MSPGQAVAVRHSGRVRVRAAREELARRLAQILRWADSHLGRTGQRPGAESGPALDNKNGTWVNVNQALRLGLRGLPGG